jgi:hypothetical protein
MKSNRLRKTFNAIAHGQKTISDRKLFEDYLTKHIDGWGGCLLPRHPGPGPGASRPPKTAWAQDEKNGRLNMCEYVLGRAAMGIDLEPYANSEGSTITEIVDAIYKCVDDGDGQLNFREFSKIGKVLCRRGNGPHYLNEPPFTRRIYGEGGLPLPKISPIPLPTPRPPN